MNPIIINQTMTVDAVTKLLTLEAYRYWRGNKTATANSLGISVRTLETWLEKYEQDERDQQRRESEYKLEQERILQRLRGEHAGASTGPSKQDGKDAANTGLRLESAQNPQQEYALPVPERQKVQEVLPSDVAHGGKRKRG